MRLMVGPAVSVALARTRSRCPRACASSMRPRRVSLSEIVLSLPSGSQKPPRASTTSWVSTPPETSLYRRLEAPTKITITAIGNDTGSR